MAGEKPLVRGLSKALGAGGTGQIELGPESGTSANWRVTSVIVQTDRPYQAPIPRIQLYLNEVSPANSLGLGPDGSFGTFVGEHTLSRGSKLIAVWSGGQAGDIASMTVNGEQW